MDNNYTVNSATYGAFKYPIGCVSFAARQYAGTDLPMRTLYPPYKFSYFPEFGSRKLSFGSIIGDFRMASRPTQTVVPTYTYLLE